MSLFHVTVQPGTAAVVCRHGAFVDVLRPGRHRRTWRAAYRVVDLRDALLAVAPQEVPTADGVTVKVTAVVRWAVADPVAYLERSADALAEVYLAAQLALRALLAGVTAEEVTAQAVALRGADLTEAVAAMGLGVGIVVREVVVRDVMLPAELRSAALEVAAARQRGVARLEAARAETAALRALANGARMLDASPALARLRLVEAAGPGTQLVLRLGPDTDPPGADPSGTG